MNSLTKALIFLALPLIAFSCYNEATGPEETHPAQSPQHSTELFRQLKLRDSILFDLGFNQCDLTALDSLVSYDLEFYHDQSGITPSKEDFINGIQNGICELDYKATRRLEPSSLEVFPLRNKGEPYGALQTGVHRFYAQYPDDVEAHLTSEARFSHLWLKKGKSWKLTRVISYDHMPFEE